MDADCFKYDLFCVFNNNINYIINNIRAHFRYLYIWKIPLS